MSKRIINAQLNMNCAFNDAYLSKAKDEFYEALRYAMDTSVKSYHSCRNNVGNDLLAEQLHNATARSLDWKHYAHCLTTIEDTFPT